MWEEGWKRAHSVGVSVQMGQHAISIAVRAPLSHAWLTHRQVSFSLPPSDGSPIYPILTVIGGAANTLGVLRICISPTHQSEFWDVELREGRYDKFELINEIPPKGFEQRTGTPQRRKRSYRERVIEGVYESRKVSPSGSGWIHAGDVEDVAKGRAGRFARLEMPLADLPGASRTVERGGAGGEGGKSILGPQGHALRTPLSAILPPP
ncbi:hypothetical protein KM043_006254 [Ampulex compressa]|nr:hypothetical protein KM043_006254 [Ampulex compressa]